MGTKKDMKKAAKYYRAAEAKGFNMVGNSWIWKDKYLDDEDRALKSSKSTSSKKGKDKDEGSGGKAGEEKDKHGKWGRKKSLA